MVGGWFGGGLGWFGGGLGVLGYNGLQKFGLNVRKSVFVGCGSIKG